MDLHAEAADRFAIYRRLEGRNRIIAILRVGVPALGIVVLFMLVGQIYLANVSNSFGVGRITVTREAVLVEAPEYAGVLDDGTTYRVWAAHAQAAVGATELIGLTDAALTLKRTSGVTMQVNAPAATLDTAREIVTIEGIAYVDDSTGTAGTIFDSVFDYVTQTLAGKGAVHIDYADGTTLDGTGMTYDAKSMVWTFSRASVTLPAAPGDDPSGTPTP